jgi:hypothetical protein
MTTKLIPGKRYGRLIAIAVVPNKENDRHRRWKFHCDCGKYTESRASSVRSGAVRSCGCLIIELPQLQKKEPHPDSKKDVYKRWKSLGLKKYKMPIVDEWSDYETFKRWYNKNCSSKKYLHRVDESLPLGPNNVKLLTMAQHNKEFTPPRLIEIDGVTKRAADWAREAGISPVTFHARLRYGFTGSKLLKPVSKRKD